MREAPALNACLTAVDYGYPWVDALAEFKFRADPGWAPALATLLRSTPWVEPALEDADWLVPIPLSSERMRERGFNQSALLAWHLSPEKTNTSLLLRVRSTTAQSSLSREQRWRNMEGVFAAEPSRTHQLNGRHVVLVDDVMTTGATLHAAAKALRQAGARRITAVVVARTV